MTLNPLAWIRWLVAHEPAIFSFGGAAVLIPVLAQIFHWSAQQSAGAAAIGAALASILTAFKARPVSVPAVTGGVVAILGALAAWKIKVPAADVTLLTTGIGALLALLGLGASLRLTPVAHLKEAARQQVSAGGSA